MASLEIAKFKFIGASKVEYVDDSVKIPSRSILDYQVQMRSRGSLSILSYDPDVKIFGDSVQLQFINLSVQDCGQEVSNRFLERYQEKDFRRFFCPSDPKRTAPASLTFYLDIILTFLGSGQSGDGENIKVLVTVGLERFNEGYGGYVWWIGCDQLVWSANKNLVQFKKSQNLIANDCWLVCRDGSSSAPICIYRINPTPTASYSMCQIEFICISPQINYHSRWQSRLPDEKLITDISLPGTHDSAAIRPNATPSACQTISITQQLMSGIRLLDIRIKVQKKSDNFYFVTCHGGDLLEVFHGDITTYQSLESVFAECQWFLKEYPREFIVIMLQIEGWSIKIDAWSEVKPGDKSALDALWALVSKFNVHPIVKIPKVSDVRGRICILNHLDNSRPIVYSDSRFGRVLGWDEKTARYSEIFPDTYDRSFFQNAIMGGFINSTAILNDAIGLFVQDYFKYYPNVAILLAAAASDKLTKYLDVLNDQQFSIELNTGQSIKVDIAQRIVLNFGSAFLFITNQDIDIRKPLLEKLGQSKGMDRLKKFGWSFFNYTNQEYKTDKYSDVSIIDLIVDANFSYSRFPDTFKLK